MRPRRRTPERTPLGHPYEWVRIAEASAALLLFIDFVPRGFPPVTRCGMAINAWWDGDSTETFWMEITDRADLGANLHAPQSDGSGRDYWP